MPAYICIPNSNKKLLSFYKEYVEANPSEITCGELREIFEKKKIGGQLDPVICNKIALKDYPKDKWTIYERDIGGSDIVKKYKH